MFELGCIYADIAVNNDDCTVSSLKDIFVVHVAKIYVRGGIGPVARITQFESHIMHIFFYLAVIDMYALNERLLNHYFEFPILGTTKAEYRQTRLRKIGIVKGYPVESQNGLDEIIKPNGFD